MASEKLTEITANNIANIDSAGYKKDIGHVSSFKDIMLQKRDDNLNAGILRNEVLLNDTNTIYTQGTVKNTDSLTDYLIKGDGFFKLQSNNGYVYSRDGHFIKDSDGYLVNDKGMYVLNKNNNKILYNNVDKHNIALYTLDTTQLSKVGNNTFSYSGQENPSSSTLEEHCLENSNVDIAGEMTDLLKNQRFFSLNSRALKVDDELLDKTCNFNY